MKTPPLSRPNDPETSQEAGQELAASGTQATLMELCLEAVTNRPGLTAGEIGDRTHLGHEKVWRRLSDLKNQGKIKMGNPKHWRGRSQATWHPALEYGQQIGLL